MKIEYIQPPRKKSFLPTSTCSVCGGSGFCIPCFFGELQCFPCSDWVARLLDHYHYARRAKEKP